MLITAPAPARRARTKTAGTGDATAARAVAVEPHTADTSATNSRQEKSLGTSSAACPSATAAHPAATDHPETVPVTTGLGTPRTQSFFRFAFLLVFKSFSSFSTDLLLDGSCYILA